MFLVMKRSEESAKGYDNLVPFKKMAKLKKLPEDWQNWIPEKLGNGEYLITEYGANAGEFSTFFHGFLEVKLRL